MTQEHFEDKFKSVGEIYSENNVSLCNFSSYAAGGTARTVWYPANAVEISVLIEYFKCVNEPYWIVGGGANTIFDDGYIETALISTAKLCAMRIEGNKLYSEAGVVLDDLVREAVNCGLAGLESLSGIPGTVGGALWMNAGAYGCEVGQRVTRVTAVLAGEVRVLSYEECNFNYRSAVGLKNAVIISAEWEFDERASEDLLAIRYDILSRRAEKQPLEFPSCGSVFKRPEGDYASRLIDAAGLKGFTIGGAQVSEKHAGFIINRDGASSSDILAVIKHCQEVVFAKFGVKLELEQQLLEK